MEQIRGLAQGELDCWFYRTHQGAEIDLLLTKGNRVKAAVEIKYSSAPAVSKGLYLAVEDVKPEKVFVLVPESEDYPNSAVVTVTGLSTFLKVHLPSLMA